MAKKTKLRNAQTVLSAVFDFNYADTMVNISGTELAFGADDAALTTFDIVTLPPGAVVIGGRVVVKTAAATSTTATIDLGDSDDPDRYTETAPIDLKDPDGAATAFDMLGDGKVYDGSQAIRATILNDGAMTAGDFIIVVNFVIPGRASENVRTN